MRTLDDVRSREDERIQDAKYAVLKYTEIAEKFKKDIENEVQTYRANIVADVEHKLTEALENEEKKEQKQQEIIEEIRQRIEKEFADQFEARFTQLELQLQNKEKAA